MYIAISINENLLYYNKEFLFMAVPKKRTSKTKKNIRKNSWKRKILSKVNKAFTLAKMIYKDKEEIKKNE